MDGTIEERERVTMRASANYWTAVAILGLGLVIPTVLGLITPYVIVAVGLVALVALTATGSITAAWEEPASLALLIAFLLLAALYAFTAQSPRDVLSVANVIMLLLFGPICLVLNRARDRIATTTPAWLAMLGVTLTVVMGLWFQLRATGDGDRMRAFNLGPIVAANATLALAVIATTASFLSRSRWSLLMPFCIIAGGAVALMGSSRGPLLGIVPLLFFTAAMLWIYRRDARRIIVVGSGAVLAVGSGLLLVLGSRRVEKLPEVLSGLLSGQGEVGDHTTDIRLALYRAGWRAFLDAPILGHGWARLMSAPKVYLGPAYYGVFAGLNQLHNDVLDFAVAGGVVGVGVYLVILFAPTVAAWRSPRDAYRPARLYATFGVVIVYAFGGLTDLMFGHEYHTALFVTLNAIVLGLIRAPDVQTADTTA